MKYFKILLGVLLVMCPVGVIKAQTAQKPITKAVLADIAAKKGQLGPFVLLTPEDVEGYGIEPLGDPCNEAAPIAFGQTFNGSLSTTDCHLDDGSFADFYFFTGTQNQQVTINLSSGTFDTYLGLANESGTFVIEDDDGGGGTNSRIIATLPATGTYFILANSVFPNTSGGYSLTLSGSTPCTYSISPSSVDVPGLGASYSFALTTQPGCQWGAVSQSSFVTVNNTNGSGSATINYTVATNTSGTARSGTITVGGQTFTITQASINCTYSITPTSRDVPAAGGTFEFTVNAPAGCSWIAYYNDWWIWTTNDPRTGTTTVVYVVQPNNGADRTGTITVAGNTFTVRQAGNNCTYSVSPTDIRVSPAGEFGMISVTTQPGCTWAFFVGYSWVEFPGGSAGTGSGTVAFRAYANNTFNARTWIVQFNGTTSTPITFRQFGMPYRTRFDFFGDSKVDLSLFRPSTGQWILRDSQFNGEYTYNFGVAGDIIVPGDYDGDRLSEIAVFRPGDGTWYIFDRNSNTYSSLPFGVAGDVPVPADYDGDGKTDIAVFRPSTAVWYVRRSSDSGYTILRFGVGTDAPVPADYDGDQKADIAIWRASVGEWWIARSSDGRTVAAQFGNSADKAVPGDYTGDGKTDIAFWRPSTGYWYILRSEDYSYYAFPFGTMGDVPTPGDYDADGITDAAVFRPAGGTWYINRSASTNMTVQFGSAGDTPLPSAYVR